MPLRGQQEGLRSQGLLPPLAQSAASSVAAAPLSVPRLWSRVARADVESSTFSLCRPRRAAVEAPHSPNPRVGVLSTRRFQGELLRPSQAGSPTWLWGRAWAGGQSRRPGPVCFLLQARGVLSHQLVATFSEGAPRNGPTPPPPAQSSFSPLPSEQAGCCPKQMPGAGPPRLTLPDTYPARHLFSLPTPPPAPPPLAPPPLTPPPALLCNQLFCCSFP